MYKVLLLDIICFIFEKEEIIVSFDIVLTKIVNSKILFCQIRLNIESSKSTSLIIINIFNYSRFRVHLFLPIIKDKINN